MCAKVIHLGCGALGLGLTIPLLKDLPETDIYLANRRNDEKAKNIKNELLKSQKSYILKVGTIETQINIFDFFYFDEIESLKEIIRKDETIYLTTALKDSGIDANLEMLADLIMERNKVQTTFPLLFIACENAINSKSIEGKILKRILFKEPHFKNKNSIKFVDSVVDRMCNYPVVSNNHLVIEVEAYCSWIINALDIGYHTHLLKAFEKLSNDVAFVNDLDFYVRRKKWIINSLHQTIALYALDDNYFLLNIFVNSHDEQAIVDAICNDTYQRYITIEPKAKIGETQAYITQFIERLANYPSKVTSALTRFKADKLAEFYADFHRKTADPAIYYHKVTSDFQDSVSLILLRTVEMIKEEKFVR